MITGLSLFFDNSLLLQDLGSQGKRENILKNIPFENIYIFFNFLTTVSALKLDFSLEQEVVLSRPGTQSWRHYSHRIHRGSHCGLPHHSSDNLLSQETLGRVGRNFKFWWGNFTFSTKHIHAFQISLNRKHFRPTVQKAGILLFSGFCILWRLNAVVESGRKGQITIFTTTPTISILKTQSENQVSSRDPTISQIMTLFTLRK